MPSAVRPFSLWNSVTALCVPVECLPSIVWVEAQLGQPRLQIAHVAARRADAECRVTRVVILRGGSALRARRNGRRVFLASSSARLPPDQSSHVLWSLDCHVSAWGSACSAAPGSACSSSACTVPNGTVPSLICSGSSVGSGWMKQPVRLPSMPPASPPAPFLMFRFTLPPPFRQESRPPRPAMRFRIGKPLSFHRALRVEPAGVNPAFFAAACRWSANRRASARAAYPSPAPVPMPFFQHQRNRRPRRADSLMTSPCRYGLSSLWAAARAAPARFRWSQS